MESIKEEILCKYCGTTNNAHHSADCIDTNQGGNPLPNPFVDSPIPKEPCLKCAGLAAQLEIAQNMNDHYASDVRRLRDESKKDNEAIGAMQFSLSKALEKITKADNLLRRANAEIAMLNARIEHGCGADKLVLCDLFTLVSMSMLGFRDMQFNKKHLAELRKAAKGV